MSIARLPDSTQLRLGSMSIPSATGLIKELLDNSIDAQATSVEVLISQNTTDRLEVRDNGVGINPDDFEFLGRPGCTSKLRCFEDLEKASATTLGFRGEALSSAKSLAVVSITTRRSQDTVGTLLEIDRANGGISSRKIVSAPVGTTVSVTKIFGNLKVRAECAVKESQKTITDIRELLISYAMARPSLRLAFKVIGSPKSGWSYSPGSQASIKEVVLQVMGPECALACIEHIMKAIPEKEQSNEYIFEAYLISPRLISTKVPKGRYISVDGRPVAARKGVMKELIAIYKKHIQPVVDHLAMNGGSSGEYFMRLNIRCPVGSYDANVEPLKDNVIFSDERFILDQFEALCAVIYHVSPANAVSTPENIPRAEPSDSQQRVEDTEPILRSPINILQRAQDPLWHNHCRVNMSDNFNEKSQEIPIRKRLPAFRRPITPSPALPITQPLEEALPILRPVHIGSCDLEGPILRPFYPTDQPETEEEELPVLEPRRPDDRRSQAARGRLFAGPSQSTCRQRNQHFLPRSEIKYPNLRPPTRQDQSEQRQVETHVNPLTPTAPSMSMPMVNQGAQRRRPQPPWTPPSFSTQTAQQRLGRPPPDGLVQSTISFGSGNKPMTNQKAFKPVRPNSAIRPSAEPHLSTCEEETPAETTLEAGDPRAYLLRRQKSIAVRPHKLRRLKSCLMPLEATPSGNQLHDLSYTTKFDLRSLQSHMKRVELFDRYVAEGEVVTGLDLNLAKGRVIEAKIRNFAPNKDIEVNLVGLLKGKAPLA